MAFAVFGAFGVFVGFASSAAFSSGLGRVSGVVSVFSVVGAGVGIAGAGFGSALKVSTNFVSATVGALVRGM